MDIIGPLLQKELVSRELGTVLRQGDLNHSRGKARMAGRVSEEDLVGRIQLKKRKSSVLLKGKLDSTEVFSRFR